VNHTLELIEGAIANDYRETLASTTSLDAAAKMKKGSGKPCPITPKAVPASGRTCPPRPAEGPKQASTLQHGVPGWSSPPAPPSA